MASRVKREWHPAFKKYMAFIIGHPNYAGMPFVHKNDGSVRWVATGKSTVGQERLKWWDAKRKQLGLPKDTAWISKTARAVHPTGKKPCQVCGQVLSLDYIYPNKRGTLSPGAMSNPPDRLDGYHTYNLCCRGSQDTGRHKDNMMRYGEDRRAYENWAEGDWKAANWLMKVFQKHGVSPDHLGPISLGFTHRPNFRPSTRVDNSARNNRMTFKDVQQLLKEELTEVVVSSHSNALWDALKKKVRNDAGALKLSKLMRENMHHVFAIFAYLVDAGHEQFLIKHFLHPEHAHYSIRFEDFNVKTGAYTKMVKTRGTKTQYTRNAQRYIRIALESLEQYSQKKNRHLKQPLTEEVQAKLAQVSALIKKGSEQKALAALFEAFELVAATLAKKFT